MVVGDGVLVVHRVEQPLVGDPQQRHAGRLVDAARLGLDDAVLDLVRHAQAVPAADRVGLVTSAPGRRTSCRRSPPGGPASKRTVTSSVAISDRRVPELHAHDRLDGLQRDVEVLQGLGLVGGAPDVGVGRVRLLLAVPVRQVALGEPRAHLVTAAQLVHEVGVEPRLVDAQLGVREQAVAVEPLDVVALERRPVTPDVDAVLVHRPHQHRAGDRAAQRRGVEVGPAAGADVERPAGQRRESLLDQRPRQSTARASSAPYWSARPGTPSMSGSSYWPMSAV